MKTLGYALIIVPPYLLLGWWFVWALVYTISGGSAEGLVYASFLLVSALVFSGVFILISRIDH